MTSTKMAEMTAAQLLDKACDLEREGKPGVADKAFRIACNRDDAEHAADPKTASLPRS